MRDSRLSQRRNGFTLVELIVVMGVIAILFAIMFPVVSGIRATARKNEAEATAAALVTAINSYHADFGKWPIPDGQQDTGGTFTSANEQKQIIDRMTMPVSGKAPVWETLGVVYNNNTSPRRPFIITISTTNTYEPVTVY